MSKRLLIVTGGAGFIGSSLLSAVCDEKDQDVWVVDSLTYASDKTLLPQMKSITLFEKSISEYLQIEEIFSEAKSKYSEINVIHLAAESHVDRSIKSGSLFIETNVLGTQNLLELSSKIGVKRFVHVSTDEVYGDVEEGESTESDQLKPSSAYAASKAASDLLVIAHVRTHGLDAVITRCSNNFGPNQAPEKFIPRVINRLMDNKPIPVYGNGDQVREWIPVSDHVRGILAALHFGKCGEIYNFGSGWRITNLEVISKIAEILDIEPRIEFIRDRLGHDKRYALDSNKSRRELGWLANEMTEVLFEETVKGIARISITPAGKLRYLEMEKFYAY